MIWPFHFYCICAANTNEPQGNIAVDCDDFCVCAWAFICYYDRWGTIITQGALGTAVITATSCSCGTLSSVIFTKHLCQTPRAVADEDEKINIYNEEQLQTNNWNKMSCNKAEDIIRTDPWENGVKFNSDRAEKCWPENRSFQYLKGLKVQTDKMQRQGPLLKPEVQIQSLSFETSLLAI